MTPLFFVDPAARAIEKGFRDKGESPYFATVLTMLDTCFDARSRVEALQMFAEGTSMAARSILLSDAERASVKAAADSGISPLKTARRIFDDRMAKLAEAQDGNR